MEDKNKILKFQIFSAVFVAILGTLLHFTYQWSNGNVIVGAFSAVNESTWEHLKLVFFPMIIMTVVGYFYIGKTTNNNFLCAQLLGILAALLFIVVFFYTYTAILGTNYSFLDIGSFFVAIVLGEYVAYKFMTSRPRCNTKLAVTGLIILFACFIVFTFLTPKIFIFQDPITGGYGIIDK